MGKHEYERTKPMLWAMFANGALSTKGHTPELAAKTADIMIAQFEQRFPIEDERED